MNAIDQLALAGYMVKQSDCWWTNEPAKVSHPAKNFIGGTAGSGVGAAMGGLSGLMAGNLSSHYVHSKVPNIYQRIYTAAAGSPVQREAWRDLKSNSELAEALPKIGLGLGLGAGVGFGGLAGLLAARHLMHKQQ